SSRFTGSPLKSTEAHYSRMLLRPKKNGLLSLTGSSLSKIVSANPMGGRAQSSALFALPPGGEFLGETIQRPGIQADDRRAALDLLDHEILIGGHLDRLVGDILGNGLWNDDHAIVVPHDDIARKHRHIAAADRHVEIE